MLDISFYSQAHEIAEVVEVPQNFYQWLAQSEFSKIGKSEDRTMRGDGEEVTVLVVDLEGETRRKLSNFLRDEIVRESDDLVRVLGDLSSKEQYLEASARLKLLQALRKCVENERFKYLSRL
ncbi:hypothetical protein [Thermoleptolyngbya sp. M55_K2018_002]|uniref:hypothetical protein n=1 Tax=Thermoleptolyngbya sp. M55_K2018_002 TaxID=2747808 RepID=UPI001A0392EC|nr:hypothetical protein [Thermoleptolyngbya sp. M55_K2018_002]HIK39345.1 hypothetical protein [Thermoleptolyngbya sp. M55_K2018_002]